MKITKSQLKYIIKEELQKLIEQYQHHDYEEVPRSSGPNPSRTSTMASKPQPEERRQHQRSAEDRQQPSPRREYDTELDVGQLGRDLVSFVPYVGETGEAIDVATGRTSPARYVAGRLPAVGTALDIVSALDTLSRPVRAQMQQRADREARVHAASPASRPRSAAARPSPRAMGTVDTLSGERSQRRLGMGSPEEAAWKRDDLYAEHIQRIVEEELQRVLRERTPDTVAQDIPTDGAEPPPPVLDRRGYEVTQADLDELGFATHEEFFEDNPWLDPDPQPETAVFGDAPIMNPPGGYASMGGGIPNWNVDRQGRMRIIPDPE